MFMTLTSYTRTERVCKPLFAKALKLQSCWTKVLGHFASGSFSNSHRSNPSPHPTNNVGHMMYPEFFFEFQLCIGWGEGELQENFKKGALFYEGTEK